MTTKLQIAADILPARTVKAKGDVVLVHGLAASRCDWVWLAPALSEAGYRAISLDLPGHGESCKPEDPGLYTVSAVYTLFEEWLDALGLDEPFTMLGHSLGGNICLRYARRHPERLAGLVLIDPYYSISQVSPLMRAVFRHPGLAERGLQSAPDWLVNALLGLDPLMINNFPSSVKQQITRDYLRASPHIMRLPATGGELLTTLHEVCLKSLVIWGERDLTLNPSSFPGLVKRLPCSEWHSIPRCGHQPHLTRPDLVNAWVLEFLEALEKDNERYSER